MNQIKNSNLNFKSSKGLSLVEVLVALLIGSLLILGALQLYLNVFRSDKVNTRSSRMQEDGRILTELLARYARRAGYQGCVSSSSTSKIATRGGVITYPDDAVQGDEESITFRYATSTLSSSSNATKMPKKNCSKQELKEMVISFENGTNSKGEDVIWINSSEFGGVKQELVKNAKFLKIVYIEPCSGGANGKCYKTSPNKNTTHIEITTEVFDPKNQIASKKFRTSVALRNRTLPTL